MKKNTEFSARFSQVLEYLNITPNNFAKKIGYERSQTMYDVLNGKSMPSYDFFYRFSNTEYSEIINLEWLINGEGEMLKNAKEASSYSGGKEDKNVHLNVHPSVHLLEKKEKNKIPFYDDVASVGGIGNLADMNAQLPTEWIDTGDWFLEATAAIRHYGDSMNEYPSGCILALKEIHGLQFIVWGNDYVIETEDFRITKRIQRGKKPDTLMAYSSNNDAYPDGTLVHEPIEIPFEIIRRVSLILGYVVKNHSSGVLHVTRKPN